MLAQKIIISVTNDLSNEYRMHKTALWLISQGYEVEMIGRKRKNSPLLPQLSYKTIRIRLPFEKGIGFYATYNLTLFFLLLFKKYDILLSVDLDTLLANFLASKIRNKRLIYDSHEYFTELPELAHRPRVKKIWHKIEKWIFPKLNFVYTVSHSIAKEYQSQYKVKVSVVRNIPNRPQNNLLLPDYIPDLKKKYREKILLYQGAVNIGRGLEEIIEAMPDLNYQLLILGTGYHIPTLKKQVELQELTHKVHFLGHIPVSDLPYYTQQAHIGLCLLNKNMGKNYQYALPNKLFEYMYADIPVLATGMPEIENFMNMYHTGVTILNNTIKDIIQGLEKIEKNYAFYQSACTVAKNELTWENEIKKIHAFFQ
ncbi:MAG: glycosyltransferase [Flammeovirgaceae bacterium]